MDVRRTRRPSWAILLLYHYLFVSIRAILIPVGCDENVPRLAGLKGRMFPFRLKVSNHQHMTYTYCYIPGHHECSKVRDLKLLLYIDCDIDAKANERKQEPGRYEREAQPSEVARESKYQKHHCPRDVGRNRIQIGLDGSKSQPANNLRQEQLHRLQRNTQTDFDAKYEPTRRLFKDGKRVLEIELLIDNGGAVGLHAVVGQIFLLLREEMRM